MSNDKIVVERPGKKIFKEGDKLVKLFDKGYSKADILNEALNQARVEETDLNIPKIQAVSVVEGCWSITMDFIEGTTLEQLMNEHPEKLDEYLELFVDIQRNVHTKRVPLLNMTIEKFNRKISAADLDATTRYELDRWTGPVSQAEYDRITPYNTRRRRGLPPSGIGAPSAEAVRAVLYPAATDALYYLHDEEGRLHTSYTYQEHLAAYESVH